MATPTPVDTARPTPIWTPIPTPVASATPTVTATGVGGTAAQMASPVPGATFSSSTVTFQWTSGTGVSQYWLWVGSHPDDGDIYSQNQRTSRSATVHGLPTTTPVYVRLWSRIGGVWQWVDYVYGPGSS
jgi:hypothetical protein